MWKNGLCLFFSICSLICYASNEALLKKGNVFDLKIDSDTSLYDALRVGVVRISVDDSKSGGYRKTVNGVFVSNDGLILTCAHVFKKTNLDGLSKESKLENFQLDESQYTLSVSDWGGNALGKAKLLAIELDHDLAVLEVSRKIPYAVKIAEKIPKENDPVYFMGAQIGDHEEGQKQIRSLEIRGSFVELADAYLIGARLGKIFDQELERKLLLRKALIVDVESGPGFSGAPLFNNQGELLSVVQGGHLKTEDEAKVYGFGFTVFPDLAYVQAILKPFSERLVLSKTLAVDNRIKKKETRPRRRSVKKIIPHRAPEMPPYDHQNALRLFLKNYETALLYNPFYAEAHVRKNPNEILIVLKESTNSWAQSGLSTIVSGIAQSTWDGFVHGVRTSLENEELLLKGRVVVRRAPDFEMIFNYESHPSSNRRKFEYE